MLDEVGVTVVEAAGEAVLNKVGVTETVEETGELVLNKVGVTVPLAAGAAEEVEETGAAVAGAALGGSTGEPGRVKGEAVGDCTGVAVAVRLGRQLGACGCTHCGKASLELQKAPGSQQEELESQRLP